MLPRIVLHLSCRISYPAPRIVYPLRTHRMPPGKIPDHIGLFRSNHGLENGNKHTSSQLQGHMIQVSKTIQCRKGRYYYYYYFVVACHRGSWKNHICMLNKNYGISYIWDAINDLKRKDVLNSSRRITHTYWIKAPTIGYGKWRPQKKGYIKSQACVDSIKLNPYIRITYACRIKLRIIRAPGFNSIRWSS